MIPDQPFEIDIAKRHQQAQVKDFSSGPDLSTGHSEVSIRKPIEQEKKQIIADKASA